MAAASVVAHSGQTDSSTTDVLPAALVGGGVAAVIGGIAVWQLRDRVAFRTLGAPTALVIVVACGTLIGIATATTNATIAPVAEMDVITAGTATIEHGRTPSVGSSAGTREDRDRRDITDLQGSIVLLVGFVLLGAATSFLMRQSELRAVERGAVYLRSDLVLEDDELEPTPDDAAIAEALADSLDELLAQSDPRLAIRAAYGSLLNGLAGIGVARHRYEGPAEHIRRCLDFTPLPAAFLSELLHLFEIARFSELPVTDADAERARHVLTASIDALAGAVT